MNGIKMDELYELISYCHEAEFMYNGTTYVFQPEVDDSKAYLVIWDCSPNTTECIAKHESNIDNVIPRSVMICTPKVGQTFGVHIIFGRGNEGER